MRVSLLLLLPDTQTDRQTGNVFAFPLGSLAPQGEAVTRTLRALTSVAPAALCRPAGLGEDTGHARSCAVDVTEPIIESKGEDSDSSYVDSGPSSPSDNETSDNEIEENEKEPRFVAKRPKRRLVIVPSLLNLL